MNWNYTSPLFDGDESQSLDALIQFSVPALSHSVAYSHSIAPDHPSVLLITDEDDGVWVRNAGTDLRGLFDAYVVKYLDNYVVIATDDWSAVPLGARMNHFIPDPATMYSYTLTVDVTYTPPTEGAQFASIDLEIIVIQNYSANRDVLKQKVSEEVV